MNSERPIANAIYRSRSAVRVSGTGKTETLVHRPSSLHTASQRPESIARKFPCLVIEQPNCRANAMNLPRAIFRALDKHLPEAGYMNTYGRGSLATVAQTSDAAAGLLRRHRVVVLSIDDPKDMLDLTRSYELLARAAVPDASRDELRSKSTKRTDSDGDWETLLRQLSL